MNRFEWLKAVQKADVTPRAKVLAGVLAVQFANDDTGQLNPSVVTLAERMNVSEDTVKRAIADLTVGGWLAKVSGRGRGHHSSYVLLSPGQVVAMRPVAAPARAAKRVQDCVASSPEKGCRTARKRVQDCAAHIRQEQTSEQIARARPAAHLSKRIVAGSWQAGEWDEWLAKRGFPPLSELSALRWGADFDLPSSTPPTADDGTDALIAEKVIHWAMEARHVHAA